MPCLVKDSKGRSPYWIACFTTRDGKRLKKSTRRTDKAEAWDVLNTYVKAEGQIASRSATEAQLRKTIDDLLMRLGERKLPDPTIKEQLDTWIESKRGAVSPATILCYQQARHRLLEFLGHRANRSVRLLERSDVVAFRNHLASEGRTQSTVNKICKNYLMGPFESARKQGLIDLNPFASLDPLKARAVQKDVFSPDQVARLVNSAGGTDWEGAILVGYTTGMRLQDVANLHWSSIDLQYGLVVFHERKNNKECLVGLHPDLADWISRQPPSYDPEAFVFPTLANRPTGGREGLSNSFAAIMEKAGVEGKVLRSSHRKARTVRSLSFHSFRHGAATAVFNRAALKEITRRVTGHAQRGSIERYIHEDIEALKAATQLIPRLPK